jgi:hypothetical protein
MKHLSRFQNYLNEGNEYNLSVSQYVLDMGSENLIKEPYPFELMGHGFSPVVRYIAAHTGYRLYSFHNTIDRDMKGYYIYANETSDTVDISISEFVESIVINMINASTKGTGMGGRVIDAVKQYARDKNLMVNVVNITNPGFWVKCGFSIDKYKVGTFV